MSGSAYAGTIAAPFTVADLDAMPDDGRVYELSRGALVVTPGPNLRHQEIVSRLFRMLDRQLDLGEELLIEAELQLTEDTVKRPDLMVVDRRGIRGQRYRAIPALVVEVTSRSTAVLDRTEKRVSYASAGIPAYWLVDPHTSTVTVLELDGDSYVERHSPSRFELNLRMLFG